MNPPSATVELLPQSGTAADPTKVVTPSTRMGTASEKEPSCFWVELAVVLRTPLLPVVSFGFVSFAHPSVVPDSKLQLPHPPQVEANA